MLTITREDSLKAFFDLYSQNIDERLNTLSRQELLGYLGTLNIDLATDDELDNPDNYTVDNIFIRLASVSSGIPEKDYLIYALTYFRHI